jgi:hypothetical protein
LEKRKKGERGRKRGERREGEEEGKRLPNLMNQSSNFIAV